MATTALESLVTRLEAVVSHLESVSLINTAKSLEKPEAAPVPSIPASVQALDDLIKQYLSPVLDLSNSIGGKTKDASAILAKAFDALKIIVLAISQCQKPASVEELQPFVAPLGTLIGQLHGLTEGKKTDEFHHLKAVAESSAALTWVLYTGKDCGLSLPAGHVEEGWAAAEFYSNKVLVQHKGVNKDHVDWVRALKAVFVPALRDYVKKYHTTGPGWNSKGIPISQFDPSAPVLTPAVAPSPAKAISREVAAASPAAAAVSTVSSVEALDVLIRDSLNPLIELSNKIGGKAKDATSLLAKALDVEKSIVLAISQCQKPASVEELQPLVAPLGSLIGQLHTLTEGKKTDEFHHLKAVAESSGALTWVLYTGKDCGLSLPAGHVEEGWAAAEFYSNKVLVQHKGVNKDHVDWVRALKAVFIPALRDYVKKYHTTGPAWNPKGIPISQYNPSAPAPTPPSTPVPTPPPAVKGPPPPPLPPPPPPPAAFPAQSSAVKESAPPDLSKIFESINKGEAITAGLKKVTADMKTKNRADRSGAVPSSTPPAAIAAQAPPPAKIAPPKAPPVFELQQGRKWVVERHVDRKDLIIEETDSKQSVYIFGCHKCVIQIKGKVNNITVDKCTKTGILFQDVVASFEVVNCTNVEAQCEGVAPTVAVDNTSGCQIFLGPTSLNASVTTAKSTGVNVLVPGDGEDADPIEIPLPEQFVHVYQDGKFVTTPVSHSGC